MTEQKFIEGIDSAHRVSLFNWIAVTTWTGLAGSIMVFSAGLFDSNKAKFSI